MNRITICILDETIEVAIKDKEHWQIKELQLPITGLYQGRILDQNELSGVIRKMKAELGITNEPVSVLVNSSCVHIQSQNVPKLSKKQYLRLIEGDYPDQTFCEDGYLIEYHIGKNTKGRYLLSYVMESRTLQEYLQCFKTAELNVSRISPYVQNIVQWVEKHDNLKRQSFVLLYMSQGTARVSVFSLGTLVFHGTLLQGVEKSDTKLLANKLKELLCSMNNHGNIEVATCYCYGMKQGDWEQLCRENALEGIVVKTLFEQLSIEQISSLQYKLFLDKNKLDFWSCYRRENINTRKSKMKRYRKFLSGITVCFFLILGFFISIELNEIEREIQINQEYIESIEAGDMIDKFEEVRSEVQYYQEYLGEVELLQKDNQNGNKEFDYIMDALLEARTMGIYLHSVELERGIPIITVKAYTGDVNNINPFMARIEQLEQVEFVEYKGYSNSVYDDGQNQFDIIVHMVPEEEVVEEAIEREN